MWGSKQIRATLNVLKTLGHQSILFGWRRGDLSTTLIEWFLKAGIEDDSKKALKLRQFVAGYRMDELAQESTPFANRPPFPNMIQMGVAFDRLLEYCLQLQIDPFEQLPEKINGLTIGCYGNWCGAMRWPSPYLQEDLDRFFREKLGARHNVFIPTSDHTLIKLGYLTDRHKSVRERNNFGGDRSKVGGDPTLRLTALAASFPLFRYTQKDTRVGFWGETSYVIQLIPSKDEKSKRLSLEQRYVRRAYHYGVKRWEMLQTARKIVRHMELINRHRQHTLKETW